MEETRGKNQETGDKNQEERGKMKKLKFLVLFSKPYEVAIKTKNHANS